MERIPEISKKIVQDLEDYFYDPSLRYNIKFYLLEAKAVFRFTNFSKNKTEAYNYLFDYCKWQRQFKKNDIYYSVLITGLDLTSVDEQGKEGNSTVGLSFTGALCMKRLSCSVVEYFPEKTLPVKVVHEIAHSLNSRHDGPPKNYCNPKKYIMSDTLVNNESKRRTWSDCSISYLDKYLSSVKSECLEKTSLSS